MGKTPLTTAAVVAALAATPAFAADMAVKASPAAPISTWSGCYVGGNMGGAWARSHWTYRNVNPYDALGPSFPIVATDNSFNMSSIIVGAQGGCNYQFANVVVGIEASWSGTRLDKTVPNVFQVFAPLAAQTVETSIDSMYTVVGRLGYVFAPTWLGYVKGGYASAHINTVGTTDFPFSTFDWMSSAWHSGFVAGGGIEYKLMDNVIAGVEYDYVGLNTKDHVGVIPGLPAVFNPVHSVNANVQSVTARISLLFGPGK